jgi:hypothetical protein
MPSYFFFQLEIGRLADSRPHNGMIPRGFFVDWRALPLRSVARLLLWVVKTLRL